MATFGYARVSSKDQNLNRQLDALREFPVKRGSVFVDRISGKDFARPGYRALVRRLKPGDTVVVKSIDRLGRDYDDILDQWRMLTRQKGVDIVVLDMPLLDTRHEEMGLTGTFIADVVLQVLSYVAQVERENIRQRQAEGIASARLRGTHLGRSAKDVPHDFDQVVQMWRSGAFGCREAARLLGVSHTTFLKWVHATRPHEQSA